MPVCIPTSSVPPFDII